MTGTVTVTTVVVHTQLHCHASKQETEQRIRVTSVISQGADSHLNSQVLVP